MKNIQIRLSVLLVAFILALTVLSSCSGYLQSTDPGNDEPDATAEREEICENPPVKEPSAMLYPANPAPGDLTMLMVGPLPEGRKVTLETGLPLEISSPYRDGGYTYFILGVKFSAAPGIYALTLSLEDPSGDVTQLLESLEVTPPDFTRQSFSMPPGLTDDWPRRQLDEEMAWVNRARLHTEPYPLWHQPFIPPLEGRISSPYGAVRFIDQRPPSQHRGIDFAVPTGTPVMAANDGVVRLAASLLAYGSTVIIDHGLNLSSSYLHMDTITVTEGDWVSRGQLIGTVGSTGFSTAPHLHWEVNLGLTPVNPLQLTRGDLDYLPKPALSYR